MMKFILVLAVSAMSLFAKAEDTGSMAQALIIDHLVKIHSNEEASVSGPIASIHSMASLGFTVKEISFSKTTSYCVVEVMMERKSEIQTYTYILTPEFTFTKTLAYKQGKKYSDLSPAYRDAVNTCYANSK